MIDKKSILIKCLSNKSGYYVKESGFKKTWPNVYIDIINFKFNEDILNSEFKIRLWHYLNDIYECPINECGNKLKFINFVHGYNKFCKTNCKCMILHSNEVREKTSFEKYGVKSPTQLPEIRSKISKTKLNYDDDTKNEINNKRKNTNLEKFGVDNVNKDKEILKRRVSSFKENIDQWKSSYKKTSLERYGVEHPWKNKEIYNKSKETLIERYGYDNPNKILKFREKIKKTNQEKYGYDYYFQTDAFKLKSKDTFLKKYNVTNPSKIKYVRDKISKSVKIHKLKKLFEKYPNIESVDGYDLTVNCDGDCQCGGQFKITKGLFFQRMRFGLEPCVVKNPIKNSNSLQNTVGEYLSSLGINFVSNNRQILNGLELDFYIPDMKIAFEFNGVYWHSELFKDKKYHIDKLQKCIDADITLIQIWEDDWLHKTELVKDMIKTKLGLINTKIGARKCNLGLVSTQDVKEFLNENHLQGYVPGKIKIGLWSDDILVSVLTLGKTRKLTNSDGNSWEIYRFAVKNGYSIPGGFSRMLSFFIRNHNPNRIITYANGDHSLGNVYLKNGFDFVSLTTPGYYWVIDGIRRHRFNFRKDILIKEGENPDLTETQIMNNRGYFRIWDSGNFKFELDLT